MGYEKFFGMGYVKFLGMDYKKFLGMGWKKFLGISDDIFTRFSCERFQGISADIPGKDSGFPDFPQNCYLGSKLDAYLNCRKFVYH